MRYLTIQDFTRYANKPDIMSSIAEFKIPKGMVYAFSARHNMSLYIQEYAVQNGVGGVTPLTTLVSSPIQCPDLGGAETAGENMKDQITIWVSGSVVTDWDIAWQTPGTAPVITPDSDVFTVGTLNVQIAHCSSLDTDPTIERSTTAKYMGTLEIRAEAPAGQNIGIPIFSGSLGEIMGNTQNYGLTPLRLQSAVLLPEGFVLAIKVLAPSVCVAGTEVLHTSGNNLRDDPSCAERIRIPYDRFNLRDFPRDLKARILHSMSRS